MNGRNPVRCVGFGIGLQSMVVKVGLSGFGRNVLPVGIAVLSLYWRMRRALAFALCSLHTRS